MSAIAWLGGSERELEIRSILVGLWKDQRGSIYAVTPGTKLTFLSVTTTRPDGERRFTRDLICTKDDTALWGRAAGQFVGHVLENRVEWRRESVVFVWDKLQ